MSLLIKGLGNVLKSPCICERKCFVYARGHLYFISMMLLLKMQPGRGSTCPENNYVYLRDGEIERPYTRGSQTWTGQSPPVGTMSSPVKAFRDRMVGMPRSARLQRPEITRNPRTETHITCAQKGGLELTCTQNLPVSYIRV